MVLFTPVMVVVFGSLFILEMITREILTIFTYIFADNTNLMEDIWAGEVLEWYFDNM